MRCKITSVRINHTINMSTIIYFKTVNFYSQAKRVSDPYGFFAERLNMSMRGVGTDDKTLIRIIVTRSEVSTGYILSHIVYFL